MNKIKISSKEMKNSHEFFKKPGDDAEFEKKKKKNDGGFV